MRKYSILFWLVIIALGATLYLLGGVNNEEEADITPTPTPTVEVTATPTPTATYNPTPIPDGQGFDGSPDQGLVGDTPDRSLITGPATCQLSNGTITFLSENTTMKEDAYISYQNVDHPGRLIFWSIDKEGEVFDVGPDIFSTLELPNGVRDAGVILEGEPHYQTYAITARINYGVLDEDGAPIYTEEVDCTGQITIELDYLK